MRTKTQKKLHYKKESSTLKIAFITKNVSHTAPSPPAMQRSSRVLRALGGEMS